MAEDVPFYPNNFRYNKKKWDTKKLHVCMNVFALLYVIETQQMINVGNT